MARKSNKTDHVLSLLSSGGKDKTEDKNAAAPKPPVEPDKDNGTSSVSIVQSSPEKEGLAETIKKSLEVELEKMIPDNVPADDESEAEKIEKMLKAEPPDPSATKEELELHLEPAGGQAEPGGELRPEEEPPDQEKTSEEAGMGKESVQEEAVGFAYVNVMERLVQEKVTDYMKQFGNCTCTRCVADTTALALTQLPPKYVVINKEAVSPLMNFYTKKYAGQITVEITKACIRVEELPHHSRD